MSATGRFHIHAPHLLSHRRRFGDAIVTGLMWILYSYLWAPLISLLAWLLGFEFAYDVMVRAGGVSALKEVLWWYGIVLASIFVTVAVWSAINRRRFAGNDRRHSAQGINDTELADYFALQQQELQSMRSANIMNLSFDVSGNIEQVIALENQSDTRNNESECRK